MEESIGEKLKSVRKEKGWSHNYLAQRTMIPASRLRQIEEGNITRECDVKLIQQLLKDR